MKRSEILFLQQNLGNLPVVEDLEYNLMLLKNKKIIDELAESYRKILQESVSPFYLECLQKLEADKESMAIDILEDNYDKYINEHEAFMAKQHEFLNVNEEVALRTLDVNNLPDALKKANLQQAQILQYFI